MFFEAVPTFLLPPPRTDACALPTCGGELGKWTVTVTQAPTSYTAGVTPNGNPWWRHYPGGTWRFCGPDCLGAFVGLCALVDVHWDDMAEMADIEG